MASPPGTTPIAATLINTPHTTFAYHYTIPLQRYKVNQNITKYRSHTGKVRALRASALTPIARRYTRESKSRVEMTYVLGRPTMKMKPMAVQRNRRGVREFPCGVSFAALTLTQTRILSPAPLACASTHSLAPDVYESSPGSAIFFLY